jgi:pyruvate kinase
MIRAGMDVARLNFSHGTHDEHARRVRLLRRLCARTGRTVAVMQDVQGPKLRLGRFEGGEATLETGTAVVLTTRDVAGDAQRIPTPIPSLPKDVRPKDPVLLRDGLVRLRVRSVRGSEVRCEVEVGGTIKDRQGIHLPAARVSVPSLTPKDRRDLAFGEELGVDYVALSFVRSEKDLAAARKALARTRTPLIAKVEKPQALEALEAIAAAADGVMIARGDLGVELPLETLPAIQKRSVAAVNARGGLTIVATEMLESMIHRARPTRAEVSDVANAILDGADAVMLSGETAAGQYPVEAVRTMARIVEEAERGGEPVRRPRPFQGSREITTGVAAAAVAAAEQLSIHTLVAYTESGLTARLISELRPRSRILALTPNPEVVRRVALFWGVEGRHVGRLHSTDAMIRQVRRMCRAEGCPAGTPVIIVAGVPLNEAGNTNTLAVHRV